MICWQDLEVLGTAAHAGTRPLTLRHDPLGGLGKMITALESLLATLPQKGSLPLVNCRSITPHNPPCPGMLLSPHEDAAIADIEASAHARIGEIASKHGLRIQIESPWLSAVKGDKASMVCHLTRVSRNLLVSYHPENLITKLVSVGQQR